MSIRLLTLSSDSLRSLECLGMRQNFNSRGNERGRNMLVQHGSCFLPHPLQVLTSTSRAHSPRIIGVKNLISFFQLYMRVIARDDTSTAWLTTIHTQATVNGSFWQEVEDSGWVVVIWMTSRVTWWTRRSGHSYSSVAARVECSGSILEGK